MTKYHYDPRIASIIRGVPALHHASMVSHEAMAQALGDSSLQKAIQRQQFLAMANEFAKHLEKHGDMTEFDLPDGLRFECVAYALSRRELARIVAEAYEAGARGSLRVNFDA